MNILIYLISFVFILVLSFVFSFPLMKICFFLLEWDFLSFKFNFYFGSILFSFILLLVTLSVLYYSTYYLNSELNFNYYYFVLLIFVGSMFSLNFSNSIFTMLVSWDLLGISSFFLVLFYNNWDSCSGAMNTALTNRFGDYFMFLFFGLSVFSSYYFMSFSFFSFYIVILLILTSFTKSAQFPFSSWLPKAMSAPTPVSSLVHSSTLVTAGLILLMNFNFLNFHKSVVGLILVVGIFTMFFSSVSALLEEDLKKVVALSTLSQMGFSMVTLGLGLSFISLIHLVSHALFKSCLFMQVGYIIHCSLGQQDGRYYSNNGNLPNFIQLQLLVTLFCLCGLIFSSGMVSKDFILEFCFSSNFMFFFSMIFFVSVFFTFGYSYRLWFSFFSNFSKVFNHYSNSFIMNFLSSVLVIFSIVFLWWLNLNMFNIPSLFIYVDFFSPLVYVIFIFLLLFLKLKDVLKEGEYKFLVDFLSKKSIYYIKDLKFMDLMLNSFNFKGHTLFSFGSIYSNLYLFNKVFNSVILIFFLLFLMF